MYEWCKVGMGQVWPRANLAAACLYQECAKNGFYISKGFLKIVRIKEPRICGKDSIQSEKPKIFTMWHVRENESKASCLKHYQNNISVNLK